MEYMILQYSPGMKIFLAVFYYVRSKNLGRIFGLALVGKDISCLNSL
jgi:hypothetical protein